MLPMFRFLAPVPMNNLEMPEILTLTPEEPAGPPCLVEPLPAIEDPEALAFEANVGSSGVVNIEGLTPTTARALNRFEKIVASAGGALVITSAYRPAAYQEHLQEVWDKYMELRGNQDEGCAELKAQAQEEFTRHQLLETQRPVAFSDHTRGIGFDAAVTLPNFARKKRRKLGIDHLAYRAGVRRPDILHDPVHFRLVRTGLFGG
jgi:hypothetical protein